MLKKILYSVLIASLTFAITVFTCSIVTACVKFPDKAPVKPMPKPVSSNMDISSNLQPEADYINPLNGKNGRDGSGYQDGENGEHGKNSPTHPGNGGKGGDSMFGRGGDGGNGGDAV